MPAQPIAATCPLCRQQRRYLPSQVFQGRLSWKLLRKLLERRGGLCRAGENDPQGVMGQRCLCIDHSAIIVGLRLARDPRACHKSERVIYAVEDAVFLANEIYDLVLLRFGGSLDYEWE
jgi:hypothetical protein